MYNKTGAATAAHMCCTKMYTDDLLLLAGWYVCQFCTLPASFVRVHLWQFETYNINRYKNGFMSIAMSSHNRTLHPK